MKTFYDFAIITLLLIIPIQMNAQKLSQEDYKSALSFMYENYNNKTAFNLDTNVNWFIDNSGIWFVDFSKNGATYKTVSFKTHRVELLFNQLKLANELNKFLDKKVTENNLSINSIEKNKSGNLIITVKGKKYNYNIKKNTLQISEEEKKDEVKPFESKSPDGKWIAYSKDYNLYIKSTETDQEYQLSFDGKKNYEYASFYGWYDIMEGENGERPRNFSVDWSKDSKWISTNVVDLRNADKMYLLDWSIDSLYKPKLLSYYRGSPGDTTMVHTKPIFFNVDNKKRGKNESPKKHPYKQCLCAMDSRFRSYYCQLCGKRISKTICKKN